MRRARINSDNNGAGGRPVNPNSARQKKLQKKADKKYADKYVVKIDPANHVPGVMETRASITYWLKELGAMTPHGIAAICKEMENDLLTLKNDAPIALLVAVKAWLVLVDDPESNLFTQVVDRVDGAVRKNVGISAPDGGPIQVSQVESLTDNELHAIVQIAAVARLIEQDESAGSAGSEGIGEAPTD